MLCNQIRSWFRYKHRNDRYDRNVNIDNVVDLNLNGPDLDLEEKHILFEFFRFQIVS